MKKKTLKLILGLILILFSLFKLNIPVYSFQTTIAIPNYYKNMDVGILAYKHVSAFQIQLADGSILLDAGISTDSNIDIIENLSDVEIVFVLDTSGSMSGTRVDTLKESSKTLVTSLFEKIGAEHLQIGVLFFNSGLDTSNILDMTNDQDTILSHLDKLYASGGTQMADSLVQAKSMLDSLESSEDAIKIICTLSDGAISDETETITQFNEINNAGISTISIFVDTSITTAFSNLASTNELHKNLETSTSNLAETIVEDIYNEIYFKIILMSEPVAEYNVSHDSVLIGGDKIIFQLDEEILHGATLRVEYVISILSAFDMNNIVVNDIYSSDFIFSSSEPLLTEPTATNADYGWYVNGNTLVTTSGSQTISAATEYRTKLVLSTVLTPERLPYLSSIGNSMTFSLNNLSDNTTISVDETNSDIQALEVVIFPPFGTTDESEEYKLLQISLLITIFTLATIILIIFVYNNIKERRRYFK